MSEAGEVTSQEGEPAVNGAISMTRTTPHDPAGRDGEVVVGLVNDGTAAAVAAAGIEEALGRGARIRFVQVVPESLGAAAASEADTTTFRAAMAAMRGRTRVRCTFELVTGSPQEALVERSHTASVLVLGEDRSAAMVARYCVEHATCQVRLVAAG